MAQKIRDVMTSDPIALDSQVSLRDAARHMRDADVGAVLVLEDGSVTGIVTDRDIVVRAIADGKDPSTTPLSAVASRKMVSLRPDGSVDEAVRLMREHSVRRLPVVDEAGRPVGIVSMGDLAVERDRESVLASVSAASPNR